ncbi:12425_t:CDS:1, partial [Cetraspora pellucida]
IIEIVAIIYPNEVTNDRVDIKNLQKREFRTLVTKFITTSSYTRYFAVTSCSTPQIPVHYTPPPIHTKSKTPLPKPTPSKKKDPSISGLSRRAINCTVINHSSIVYTVITMTKTFVTYVPDPPTPIPPQVPTPKLPQVPTPEQPQVPTPEQPQVPTPEPPQVSQPGQPLPSEEPQPTEFPQPTISDLQPTNLQTSYSSTPNLSTPPIPSSPNIAR